MARNHFAMLVFELSNMKKYISLVVLASFTLVFAGCSKHSSDTTSTPQTNVFTQVGTNHYVQIGTNHYRLAAIIKRGVAVNTNDLNLGVIEVSDGVQSRHDLGDGKACIITPTIHNDSIVVLEAEFEESGKLLALPKQRVQTVSGRPATFFDGTISFELTPYIKQ